MLPTADLRIRFARVGEREALEALQWRASLAWEDQRASLLANPDAIVLPVDQLRERRVRVAEVRGDVAGFAVVLPARGRNAELDGLFVEPTAWKGGIGAKLVGDGARIARRRGARALMVIANPRALGFYEKVGFVEVGRAKTRFGPAIRMRLDLTGSARASPE